MLRADYQSPHAGHRRATNADMVTAGLLNILTGAGPLLGLAAAVYMLAPSDEGARPGGVSTTRIEDAGFRR